MEIFSSSFGSSSVLFATNRWLQLMALGEKKFCQIATYMVAFLTKVHQHVMLC